MSEHLPELIALVVLVGAAAFFAASEAAIVSINRIRARALGEKQIKGARRLQRLVEDRNRTLTSVLIGSTFVLLAADSVATALFIHLDIPNAAIWSTVVMTVVILLFGEILAEDARGQRRRPRVAAARTLPRLHRAPPHPAHRPRSSGSATGSSGSSAGSRTSGRT